MTIEGNKIRCDGLGGKCPNSIRIHQSGSIGKTETAAKHLGWKFVGEDTAYCPNCA